MKINFMVPASDGVWSLRSKTISRERKGPAYTSIWRFYL